MVACLAEPADATWSYLTGQRRESHAALLEAFTAESEAVVARLKPALDLPYGALPRETLDYFRTPLPCRGVVAYFHAGYWQSRDKAQFHFIVPAFLATGLDVAMVNYPLCPDATLPALLESARRSVPAVLAQGRGEVQLVAAGHSAGGHIAAELALTDWAARGFATNPVHSVVALSGVYDLTPLLKTSLNDRLGLNAAAARAMSPLHRVGGALPQAVFAVGGLETRAFHAQSASMQEAWVKAGNQATLIEVPDADHFSVLRAMVPGQRLFNALEFLLGSERPQG